MLEQQQRHLHLHGAGLVVFAADLDACSNLTGSPALRLGSRL